MPLEPAELPENTALKASFLVTNTESTYGVVGLTAFVDDVKVSEGSITAGKVKPEGYATVWVDIPALKAGAHVLKLERDKWSITVPLTVVAPKPAGTYDVAVEVDPSRFILYQSQYVTQLTPEQAKNEGFYLVFTIKNKGTVNAQPLYTLSTPTWKSLPKSVGQLLSPNQKKEIMEFYRVYDVTNVNIEAVPTQSEGADADPSNNLVTLQIPVVEPPKPVVQPVPAPLPAPTPPQPIPVPVQPVTAPVSQQTLQPRSLSVYIEDIKWEQKGQLAYKFFADEPLFVTFYYAFREVEPIPASSVRVLIDGKQVQEVSVPAVPSGQRVYPVRISLPALSEGKHSVGFVQGLFQDQTPLVFTIDAQPVPLPDIEVSPEKLVTQTGEYWLVQNYQRLALNALQADVKTTARVWVRNIGKLSASPLLVATIDGTKVATQEVNDVEANFNFRTIVLDLNTLSEGQHTLKIRAELDKDPNPATNEIMTQT